MAAREQENGAFAGPFVRLTGSSDNSERFEHARGAMTLGWNDRGDIVAVVTDTAVGNLVAALARRITQLVPIAGPVRLYLDLTHAATMDPAFRDDLARLMCSGDRLVESALVAVRKQSLRLAITTLSLKLDGRLEIDDSAGGLEAFLERMG